MAIPTDNPEYSHLFNRDFNPSNKDVPIIDNSMPPRTSYEKQKQQESMESRKKEMQLAIAAIEQKMKTIYNKVDISVVVFMDAVEEIIKVCGGEHKVRFMDVGRDFVKIHTRVPLSANLFQFMPESDDNPRFHKVVTKILMINKCVKAVKWVSLEEGARGALLLVELCIKEV